MEAEGSPSRRWDSNNFRALVEQSPAIIFVHREGELVYANSALVRLLGYARVDDLLGRSLRDSIHPEDWWRVEATMRARRERDPLQPAIAVRFLRCDGRAVVVEGSGLSLVFDGLLSTVVVAQDVTEQKELQARLLLSDRMVSLGTLAAGVAHEINNPLAYILANLELAIEELSPTDRRKRSLPPLEIRSLLEDAREGAERVRRIVRGLKSFSRADEERKVALELAPVLDVSSNMVLNEIRHRARLVKAYGKTPRVWANESRLAQVFINLLVNAAQALPDGRADRHEIRVATSTDANGYASIEVSDTGTGIAADVLPRIFDPFFTTKPIGVGTGLGLSICHGIVASLGGEIGVETSAGQGARFRVLLPPVDADLIVDEVTPPPPSSVDRPRGRVLVVEDEELLGSIIRRMLSSEHDVCLATDGGQAFDRIRSGSRFDAILCDLMMPVMTGVDFYERVASVAPAQAGRIIFMSGGVFSPTANAFLGRVDNPRMEKPFDGDSLRMLVAEMVGRRDEPATP